jgi:hypothetical protein
MAGFLNAITGSVSVVTTVGNYESIATVSVGSGGQASVTFSSIPNTFKHLQIRGFASGNRSSAGYDNIKMNLGNGSIDTAANYSYHVLSGDPRPYITAEGFGSQTTMVIGDTNASGYSGVNTSMFSVNIIDILDYTSTVKNKTVRQLGGTDRNGAGASSISGNVGIYSGAYYSLSVVNTIEIKIASGNNFNQYTHFALYGIK